MENQTSSTIGVHAAPSAVGQVAPSAEAPGAPRAEGHAAPSAGEQVGPSELNGYEECRQCGDCCNIRIVAIKPDEVERIRAYIADNGIVARDNGPFTCPLLGEDMRCMVWPVRSQTCRLHSCERTRAAILADHPEVERESDRHWLDMRGAWLHGDFRDAREIDYFGEGLIDEEMQAYIDSL